MYTGRMTRVLGIDYGRKRVGLALSDEAGGIAFPREELANDEKLLGELTRVVQTERVGHVVVGDTRAPGGAPNRITEETEDFMKKLSAASGVPVEGVPEVWSSIEASRYAPKGREHDNAAAAAFILQRYLDMHEGSDRMRA